MVVCCVVVVALVVGCVTAVDSRVVVVDVVAGFSTTVVQDVRTMVATARAGTRMISFFMCVLVVSPSVRSYVTR